MLNKRRPSRRNSIAKKRIGELGYADTTSDYGKDRRLET
jgi:hypothetical protein